MNLFIIILIGVFGMILIYQSLTRSIPQSFRWLIIGFVVVSCLCTGLYHGKVLENNSAANDRQLYEAGMYADHNQVMGVAWSHDENNLVNPVLNSAEGIHEIACDCEDCEVTEIHPYPVKDKNDHSPQGFIR